MDNSIQALNGHTTKGFLHSGVLTCSILQWLEGLTCVLYNKKSYRKYLIIASRSKLLKNPPYSIPNSDSCCCLEQFQFVLKKITFNQMQTNLNFIIWLLHKGSSANFYTQLYVTCHVCITVYSIINLFPEAI